MVFGCVDGLILKFGGTGDVEFIEFFDLGALRVGVFVC